VTLKEQFHVYSDPSRDPRHHTVSVVFIADAAGSPVAADAAARAGIFSAGTLPSPLAFDHARILADYFRYAAGEKKTAIFR
jgi:8-oxo-dGTP diphosphatase